MEGESEDLRIRPAVAVSLRGSGEDEFVNLEMRRSVCRAEHEPGPPKAAFFTFLLSGPPKASSALRLLLWRALATTGLTLSCGWSPRDPVSVLCDPAIRAGVVEIGAPLPPIELNTELRN